MLNVLELEGTFGEDATEMSCWTWYVESRIFCWPHGSRNISQWQVEYG